MRQTAGKESIPSVALKGEAARHLVPLVYIPEKKITVICSSFVARPVSHLLNTEKQHRHVGVNRRLWGRLLKEEGFYIWGNVNNRGQGKAPRMDGLNKKQTCCDGDSKMKLLL